MDLTLALTLIVLALVLWTFVPAPARDAVRGGFGPLVHAIAEGVRGMARAGFEALGWLLRWVFDVKDLREAPHVLSSSQQPAGREKALSTLQTDEAQTRQTEQKPKPSDEQFLTLFAVFKEAGYNRDEARAILRPFSVPVDNNLFSKAPKPIEPQENPGVAVPAYENPPA